MAENGRGVFHPNVLSLEVKPKSVRDEESRTALYYNNSVQSVASNATMFTGIFRAWGGYTLGVTVHETV